LKSPKTGQNTLSAGLEWNGTKFNFENLTVVP